MEKIKIPSPTPQIQNKLLEEIQELDDNENSLLKTINNKEKEIVYLLDQKESFNKVKLDNICDIKGGKRVPFGHSFIKHSNYPYIRVADFENYSINTKGLKYISEDTFNLISAYTISKDDIYISIAGTIGIVGLVPDELNNKSLTENAAKLIIKNKGQVNKKYLMYYLASQVGQNQVQDRIKTLGTPKLALNRIETIEVKLPKIEEQNTIVQKIELLEQDIKILKEKILYFVFKKEVILKKYL